MNDTLIVTIFVTIDEVMHLLGHRSHPKPGRATAKC